MTGVLPVELTNKSMRKIQISQPVTGEEEWLAVREPLETGWLTSGPKVRAFETRFGEIHGVKHAIACTSATSALHLAMAALGVKEGDEVIVPAFTWVSTANVVEYMGAKPVFVDIDLSTFNLGPAKLKAKITDKTSAIIAVHLFGLCADMDEIKNIAGEIPIVEDAACAAGAQYGGVYAGALGDIGCFSFHPRKSVTTGEGGMVTSQSDRLAEVIGMMRNHGASISEEQRHHGPQPFILPEFNLLGYNYRMTDLQGAVGCVQIEKLEGFIAERDKWAKFYIEELAELEWLKTPIVPEGTKHGWQSFVCSIDEGRSPYSRNKLMQVLEEKGISTRPGTHAVHMLGYYANKYEIKSSDFPEAKKANDLSMAIPLHNRMSPEDYQYVVDTLKSI